MTRYELTERIGAGAMAEIFRGKAVAAGGFEKPVAIKRILPHLSQDEHFVELLIAEANIVSHLRHRNIVQVFDVGTGTDGQYFLVMELVDGCNLGMVQAGLETRGKRMPAGLGLYIGAEICDALEHAHRAPGPDGKPLRLVHRDVSPNNVLLSRSGEVKLTDFGIAKRTEEVSLGGGVRGKFAYISPEQGSGRAVDARSDVFSVGILLFEMIVGRRLFSGLADFEALRQVCEGNVPRPRSIDPKLDPKLEIILLKALAHNADDRYASASELGKDLRAYRYSLPQDSGDPASELASLVTRITKQGGQSSKKEAPAAGVRRPEPDDFTGGTNTFTVEDDESLVRRTSYEEAWQRFRAEEGRVAQTYRTARESGEMPSATMVGIAPPARAGSSQPDGDTGEEETRVVDPYLRSSRPMTRQTPIRGKSPGDRFSDMGSEAATLAVDAAAVRPDGARYGAAFAGGSVAARLPVPDGAAPVDDFEGVPPETLELRESQAHRLVDAVDAALVAAQSSAPMPAPADGTATSDRRPSEPLARAKAADPIAVVRVSTVPSGTTAARKGFPRWAVILFVVLLVCIILAGFLLGDGTKDTGASEVTPPPGAAALVAVEPAAVEPAAVEPATLGTAEPATTGAAATAGDADTAGAAEMADAVEMAGAVDMAAASPVDAGAVDTASARPAREEAQARSMPAMERPVEKAQATRAAEKTQATRAAEKTQATRASGKTQAARSPAEKTQATRAAEKTQATRASGKTQAARSPAEKTQATRASGKTQAARTSAEKTQAARTSAGKAQSTRSARPKEKEKQKRRRRGSD